MKRKSVHAFIFMALVFVSSLALTSYVSAQTQTGTLRGRVADPSDAVVPQATVIALGSAGQKATTNTKADGTYEFKDLSQGKYTIRVTAKGFAPFEQPDVNVLAGQSQKLDVSLSIEVEKQVVNVEEQAQNVEVDPSNNASSVVIKGKDLDALSDDPDELQDDLLALAGPSAGPNGGQIYIDGFTNGQLPPKSAIREIRINQNPFSAEFDHIGFGRIEVFTKPGQDKFRGSFMMNANNSIFNSRNPFMGTGELPDYHSEMYSGNFSGPISKSASFFFNAERRNVNDSSVINALVLSPLSAPGPNGEQYQWVSQNLGVLNPQVRQNISPRFDYQISKSNTLTARYQLGRSTSTDSGIGGYNLVSQATHSSNTNQSFQVSDTQIISNTTINETRFQYNRNRMESGVTSFDPTLSVAEAFTSGGNSRGTSIDHRDSIEFQNYTSKMIQGGRHFLKFGGRLRFSRDAVESNSGYNGSFSFSNPTTYLNLMNALANGQTVQQFRQSCDDALLAKYNVTDLASVPTFELLNCGPSQFSITAGIPSALVSQTDLGAYVSDDWKVRPNITLSYGLRFETQNNIGDHVDWAPRLAIAWGIGRGKGTPKTVLRAGYGMFYDRFSMNNVLRAEQLDGVHQQQFILQPTAANPGVLDFWSPTPVIPPISTLQAYAQTQSIYRIDPNLHSEYMMQAAVALERQLTRGSTVSVNYINSRGLHQLSTININAPLTPNGLLPDPGAGPIFQYQDDGIFKQQQMIASTSVRLSSALSLNAYYSLSYVNSTPGMPSNQYNLMADYGRGGFDVRHRGMVIGTISLPYGFRFSPIINYSSGRPFNIIIGQDINGDRVNNDRPSFADPSNTNPAYVAGLKVTPWGTFNLNPLPNERIVPINYGTGPGEFAMSMRVSKTFAIGKRREVAQAGPGGGDRGFHGPGGDHGPGGGGPGHGPGGGGGPRGGGGFGRMGPMGGMGGGSSSGRYSLTISADARNVFNNVNYSPPISNLSSGRIGQYTSLAGGFFGGGSSPANRRVSLQAMFNF